ncbi:MAG: MoaD/ThiS family protein [Chloroflexota bacterium]
MGVKVNISSILAQSTGNQTVVTVEGSTVAECLDDLIKQFPDLRKSLFDKDGKLHSFLDIYVNKQSAYPETLAKPVKEGDEIHIMFLIGGG